MERMSEQPQQFPAPPLRPVDAVPPVTPPVPSTGAHVASWDAPAPGPWGQAPLPMAPGLPQSPVPEERPGFVTGFTPVTLANQVATMGSRLWRSIVRALLGAAFWTGIWWWQRENWGSPWWLLAGYSVTVAMIAFTVWQMVVARKALRRIGQGEALRATAQGLVLHDLDGSRRELDWSQVQVVRVEGHEMGAGPRISVKVPRELAVQLGARPKRWWQRGSAPAVLWQIPLYYLDALPGTIDGALRAFSQGVHGLDVTGLDTFW